MGIALALAGIILIVTGAQNTYSALGTQLRNDFTGQNNFTWWFLALVMVGMLGYVPQLRTFSRWFLALILLAILLSHKGFFANLTTALKQGPKSSTVPQSQPQNSGSPPGLVSPLQGLKQGNGGTGIDWLAPFRGLFK